MPYSIELTTVTSGYDRRTCWVGARAGVVPPSTTVLTAQKLRLSGSDIFYALHSARSDDLGRNWLPLRKQDTLDRRPFGEGGEIIPCGFTPAWHAGSGKLLGTGHSAFYINDEHPKSPVPCWTSYSVYDADADCWGAWKTLVMPDDNRFFRAGAGATQRVDLPNGDILLPIYFGGRTDEAIQPPLINSTVLRCQFDGESLTYVEHGDELTVPETRGLAEPSLVAFAGRYFLTLRNDQRGYVARSDDGLHFEPPRPWTFDDGEPLGSYNTQQHWIAHSDALFLAYTRRGAHNDHVLRHRAPIFLAQVDPERLCVIRATERVVIPERGASLGNFGTAMVSGNESWIIAAEWMQTTPPNPFDCMACERYGSDNRVFISRIQWDNPNRLVSWESRQP